MTGPGPAISFVGLPEASPAQGDAARRIYEESFPARQRVPFGDIRAPGGRYRAELALRDGRVVAIAFASRLVSAPWIFLEYVAVDPGLRGGGVGARVWSHVCEGALAGGATGVVLEIEDPAQPGIADHERDVRLRRERFWERCGAVRLPVAGYVVPNLDGTGAEPFVLMAWPPGRPAGDAAVSALVRALRVEGYGLPGPTRP